MTSEVQVAPRKIRVTVGILSWNRKDALRIALRSVEKQSIFRDVEVIVLDNASSDGTPAMLQLEYPWVTLVNRDTNSGVPEGRNILVRLANAPIVFWMDDDCELVEDNVLESLVVEMESHPNYAVVFARILAGDHGDAHIHLPSDVQPKPFEFLPTFPASFSSGGTCVRKPQFFELGGYDGDFFYNAEEHAFAYRVFNASCFIRYFPAVTIIHRPYPIGRSSRRATFFATRNYLLGLWRYQSLRTAFFMSLFELPRRLAVAARSMPRLIGFLQAVVAVVCRLPRCFLRERRPMNPAGFSRWAHCRQYVICTPEECCSLPLRYSFWRFALMELKLRVLGRFGWSRKHPYWNSPPEEASACVAEKMDGAV
jgi:GT2 family glycosyltransferase